MARAVFSIASSRMASLSSLAQFPVERGSRRVPLLLSTGAESLRGRPEPSEAALTRFAPATICQNQSSTH